MQRRHLALSTLLVLALSLIVLGLTPLNARAEDIVATGTWGTCPWEISAGGTLTIHPGVGADHEGAAWSPWSDYAKNITSVVCTEEGGQVVVAPSDCSGLFYGFSNVSHMDVSHLDTSGATDMQYMFYGCQKLPSLDLSSWDVSHVARTRMMFQGCFSLSYVDFSGWDVSSLRDMEAMFSNCAKLQTIDLSTWNQTATPSPSKTNNMFRECISLYSIDLSGWNVLELRSMEDMFRGCTELVTVDLSGWDTSNVTMMARAFSGDAQLKTIYVSSEWSTAGLSMSYGQTFYGCTSLVGGNGTAYKDEYQTAHYARIDAPGNPGLLTDSSQRPERTSLTGAHITVAEGETYTGAVIVPEVTVMLGGVTLRHGVDFAVAYIDNVNAGTATAIAYGIGAYAGHTSTTFEIAEQSIEGAFLRYPDGYGIIYDGTARTFDVGVVLGSRELTEGFDYTVRFSDNVNAGTGKFTVTGIGNYAGEINETFTIAQASLSNAEITLDTTNYIYDGTEKKPGMTVVLDGRTLVEGTDYSVEYKYNVDVDEYGAIASGQGIGNYKDSARVTFFIDPRPIAEAVVAPIPDQDYTGQDIEPGVEITYNGKPLVEYTDYVLEYSDNTEIGTATVTITGMENFSGSVETSFRILETEELTDIEGADIVVQEQTVYRGFEWTPSLFVTLNGIELVEGTDYTAGYSNNANVGIATVTITGTGSYTGTATQEFEILPEFIFNATVAPIPDQTWVGSAVEPRVTLTYNGLELVPDTDYTVTYENNVGVGTATAYIVGKGNFDNETQVDFNIVESSEPQKIDITERGRITAIPDQTYTGGEIEPDITVLLDGATLANGADYEVEYQNNINAGTAKVTIIGIGRYEGTVITTFNIVKQDAPEPSENPFRDVSAKTPHHDDIIWLAASGVSAGWTEKDGTRTFRPTNTVIRQDMAAFLFRLAKSWGLVGDDWQPTGSVTFKDVSPATPHYREIMWLAESGISAGWKVGSAREFRPTNTVIRQDMAAFLRRLQALRDPSVRDWKPTGASPFRDVTARTPHYDDILWLAESGVSAGWTVGGSREFRPTNTVIRQDMAAFLHRLDGLG